MKGFTQGGIRHKAEVPRDPRGWKRPRCRWVSPVPTGYPHPWDCEARRAWQLCGSFQGEKYNRPCCYPSSGASPLGRSPASITPVSRGGGTELADGENDAWHFGHQTTPATGTKSSWISVPQEGQSAVCIGGSPT